VKNKLKSRSLAAATLALVLLLATPSPAAAYVGPGAGFVFVTSFLVIFVTGLMAVVSMLLWPFRMTWRALRRVRRARPRIKRLIVIGFDGQDPKLTDRFLGEGKLPNFQRLAETGCYHRLATTYPSVSPVAWSSFSTGTHPAKHNIFDFLDRDRRTYLPILSSTRVGKVERFLRLGRFRLPLKSPELRLLRKSKAFWSILGERNIWSTILRVPITFPPDRFYGAQLSAMSVPDLLGTQGTFTLFTTRRSDQRFKEGGTRVELEMNGDRIDTAVQGPANPFIDGDPPLEVPLRIELDRDANLVRLSLDGARLVLQPGVLSDWVNVGFGAVPGVKIRGICRVMVTEIGEHFSLYMTPINIDPEKPAMPISHPHYYAIYLAKKLGKYATTGLAEDTWALNEGVIGDETFLQLTYDIDGEREEMFLTALDKLRQGVLVCVFDATDRIQHMFWRYLEAGHPANGGAAESNHRDAIEKLYTHNDAIVGRAMNALKDGDVLMVLSDHGFSSFRRGVNLNSWLQANGYLTLKEGTDGSSDWLRDVDWSKTRAYALGLTGLYLNLEGREAKGIVAPGDTAMSLKTELIDKLSGLVDEETGDVAIREVFATDELYKGPYLENAPDMLIGYNAGYRTSWDGATGVVAGPIFEDNRKPWSGDHCIDPRLVPGVLFCNRPIQRADPALVDIAPTALWLFGVEPPRHMDGSTLFRDTGRVGASSASSAEGAR
jgi:predicted AlkP superfamily phosphohydrolase/phosphomutase